MTRRTKWKIGELEGATGATRDTIHFYVKEGLLPPPTKTGATSAWFGREHVERLLRIGALRGAGLSLPTVQRVLLDGGDALPLEALRAVGARLAPFDLVHRTHVAPRSTEATEVVEALALAPMANEYPALSEATEAIAALAPHARAAVIRSLQEIVPRVRVLIADECALQEGAVDQGVMTADEARGMWDAAGALIHALRDADALRLRRLAAVARVTPPRRARTRR